MISGSTGPRNPLLSFTTLERQRQGTETTPHLISSDRQKMPLQHAASWPEECPKVLVNLWCKNCRDYDFGRSIRNVNLHEKLSKSLGAVGINWTAVHCREHIKDLQSAYCKAKNENCKSSISLATCHRYEDFFNQVFATTPGTELTVLYDYLPSGEGMLFRVEAEGSGTALQVSLVEESEEQNLEQTTVLELALDQATQQDGLGNILVPYSKDLFWGWAWGGV
ncbi:uncharacterized protein [Lepidochelys kempii]|uniref:uncharacterized protein n=1 Tax=Lepidochelys kempii TaxID=8472 RepID=UPI003C6FF0B8